MPGSTDVLFLLALLADGMAVAALEISHALANRILAFVLIVSYALSLLCLTFALPVHGFTLGVIDAAWSGVGIAAVAATHRFLRRNEAWSDKEIGPVGTMARVGLGLGLVGSVVQGQLATHYAPAPWILGLIGFPGLAVAWHAWRIHHHPATFHDTSPLSFALSVALPIVLYLTWWYAPAVAVASDGTLIFVGISMVLAGVRGSAGCEMLAVSNLLLRRRDQIACAVFTSIDAREWRSRHSGILQQGGNLS